MTLVLASQCQRVARRHLPPHNDLVRISEALLAIAFDRCCVTSGTPARYGSSVPGPMENRKRMGKRKMGDLSVDQSHSALPPWGIDNVADLTKWQWKPPSLPNTPLPRRQAEDAQKPSPGRRISSKFDGPASASSPEPPDAMDTIDTGFGSHEAPDGTGEGRLAFTPQVTRPTSPRIIWGAQSSPIDIGAIGVRNLDFDLSSIEIRISTETGPKFAEFCDSWRDWLADDNFSGEDINVVLDGIQYGLNVAFLDAERYDYGERLANNIAMSLFDATTAGLSERATGQSRHSDASVWDGILLRIADIPVNTLRMFTLTMTRIPDPYMAKVFKGIMANLRAFLDASGYRQTFHQMFRQVNKMVLPLGRIDPAIRLRILENGARYVLGYKNSRLYYPRIRFAWLQLLARLPHVDDSHLAKQCSTLEAGLDTRVLSNREIGLMYLGRHRSVLSHVVRLRNALQVSRHCLDSEYYGLLCKDLWKTEQCDHIKGLCEFLRKLGRGHDVIRLMMGFRDGIKDEVTPLVNIALKSALPQVALEICSLYEKSKAEIGTNFWNTQYSNDAVKLLSKHRTLKAGQFLDALHLQSQNRKPFWFLTMIDILKTAKVTMSFALSPSVSARTSLALMSQCLDLLQISHNSRRDAVVPIQVLRTLLHVITRDLARGEPGRTTRLRWFLYLLHKQAGREKMLRIGLGLKRWREINARRSRIEMNRRSSLAS